MTSLVITGFILESRSGVLPKGPQIVYAEDFAANRTDDQIRADQRKDAAERREAADERRRQWKKVDDSLSKYGF
jgi:hypothetical protein